MAAVSGHTPARALSQGGEDASSAGRSTCCRQSLWAGTKEPPGGRQSTRLPKTPMPSLPWSVFIKMCWLRGPAAKERRSGPPPSAGCALPPAAPPGRGGGWVWPLAPPARLPARPAASRRLPARSLRAAQRKWQEGESPRGSLLPGLRPTTGPLCCAAGGPGGQPRGDGPFRALTNAPGKGRNLHRDGTDFRALPLCRTTAGGTQMLLIRV